MVKKMYTAAQIAAFEKNDMEEGGELLRDELWNKVSRAVLLTLLKEVFGSSSETFKEFKNSPKYELAQLFQDTPSATKRTLAAMAALTVRSPRKKTTAKKSKAGKKPTAKRK
jgi:hypothetical protein